MNNLLSYCGLVDAKIRASDIDLPVLNMTDIFEKIDGINIFQLYFFFDSFCARTLCFSILLIHGTLKRLKPVLLLVNNHFNA